MNIGEANDVNLLIRHFAPGIRPDLDPPTPAEVLQAVLVLAERAAKALGAGFTRAEIGAGWSWELHLLDRDGELWSQVDGKDDVWLHADTGAQLHRSVITSQWGAVREVWIR